MGDKIDKGRSEEVDHEDDDGNGHSQREKDDKSSYEILLHRFLRPFFAGRAGLLREFPAPLFLAEGKVGAIVFFRSGRASDFRAPPAISQRLSCRIKSMPNRRTSMD